VKFKGYFIVTILIASLFAQALPAQNLKSSAIKQTVSATDASRLAQMETQLENLRHELKIPALSAAVVKDQKIVWAKGFGFADLENKIPATEHTPYHLASLTKTFTSTILMQLVQEGKIKLDDPVSNTALRSKAKASSESSICFPTPPKAFRARLTDITETVSENWIKSSRKRRANHSASF
jgi:CubicO group peptidase (beta-lactamase class C family)